MRYFTHRNGNLARVGRDGYVVQYGRPLGGDTGAFWSSYQSRRRAGRGLVVGRVTGEAVERGDILFGRRKPRFSSPVNPGGVRNLTETRWAVTR